MSKKIYIILVEGGQGMPAWDSNHQGLKYAIQQQWRFYLGWFPR